MDDSYSESLQKGEDPNNFDLFNWLDLFIDLLLCTRHQGALWVHSWSVRGFQLGLYMRWGNQTLVINKLKISVASHNRHLLPIQGIVQCRHSWAVFQGSSCLELFLLLWSLHWAGGWLNRPWRRIHAYLFTITTQKWNILVLLLPCWWN